MGKRLITPAILLAITSGTAAAHISLQQGTLSPARRAQPATPVQSAPATATVEESPEQAADAPTDIAAADPAAPTLVTPEPLDEDEVEFLRAHFDSLPSDQQDEMKAYYLDLGINLDEVLGLAAAQTEAMMRSQEIQNALRGLDFARTPQNVLGARAKLGFGEVARPNPKTARGSDIARWVHLLVQAGEWESFAAFLKELSDSDAQSLYSAVLQSLNSSSSGLLPEEVLSVTEAIPSELKTWHVRTWTTMIASAVAKNSPATLLERIAEGTRFFGSATPEMRRRTVDLLAGAGLVEEAYAYLPPLEDARASGDGEQMIVHGQYRVALAQKAGPTPEADAHRQAGWSLFCEVTAMDRASMSSRAEAVELALGQMPHMPRSQVTPWLESVFANDILGPAALEGIALRAVNVNKPGDTSEAGEASRAQSIVTFKQAMDVLLERRDLADSVLRIPLRMLTTALITEMEQVVAQQGNRRTVSRGAQLLLRAIPDQKWMNALEPSLAVRADRACVELATSADETDQALGLLRLAIDRNPDAAHDLAGAFLRVWEQRLSPASDYDNNIWYFWSYEMAQAPLTRGRQRRNLERLANLMQTLRGIGIEPRSLPEITQVFQACHGMTEVFERNDVERIFGPIDQIPPTTSATLAQAMAGGLNGDWRNRAVQIDQGVKRTDAEIAQLVDEGYALAIDLAHSALAAQPDSWRYAVLQAALTYDRLQFRMTGKQAQNPESTQDNEVRMATFTAFKEAADRYATAVSAGEEREDPTIYLQWFGAAMGTSQIDFLSADEMPKDGTRQSDQVDLIKASMATLPPESHQRHLAEFARALSLAVSRAQPDVKPKLVKQALRVVGDDPAGATLRGLDELYRDLVKDEIKLRLTIDGGDSVGTDRPFGVMLSMRYTNSVDRETGGFAKYLQNGIYARVGRQYQMVNYRDKLEKSLRETLSKGFTVEAIGFFDPFMPSRGVAEAGEGGWLEKPMAYIVLSRDDPAVDHVPQVTLDMQFQDNSGPVTLVLPSNIPGLAVTPAGARPQAARPCVDMHVVQVVDPRDARDGEGDRAVTLEIIARGDGVVPELHELLEGINAPLDGYVLAEDAIETRPISVIQEGSSTSSSWYWTPPTAPEGGYPEADETGMYRLPVERTWLVTYTPGSGSAGSAFTMPALQAGLDATLESKYYSDMDLRPVAGMSVAIDRPIFWLPWAFGVAAAFGVLAILWFWRLRERQIAGATDASEVPTRVTPLSAAMTLRNIQRTRDLDAAQSDALSRDIRLIEHKYFAPQNGDTQNIDLSQTLQRWVKASRS